MRYHKGMITTRAPRSAEPNIAQVAGLIGDPGRAAMLLALFDGRELAASELAIAEPARIVALEQSTSFERMRLARSCYDHLAGRLGVAITDALVERGAIEPAGSDLALAARGRAVFSSLGIDVDVAREQRRGFARTCVDWTERRPHLAGSLGAAVLELFLRERWVARSSADRSLRITADGMRELRARFDLRW
jgi:hypothetical protein